MYWALKSLIFAAVIPQALCFWDITNQLPPNGVERASSIRHAQQEFVVKTSTNSTKEHILFLQEMPSSAAVGETVEFEILPGVLVDGTITSVVASYAQSVVASGDLDEGRISCQREIIAS